MMDLDIASNARTYLYLAIAYRDQFLERISDTKEIFSQSFIFNNFFGTVLLHEKVDQLNNSIESEDTPAIFEQFDEPEKSTPYVE